MSAVLAQPDALDQLLDDLASFELDPLGFVEWAYPWGEAGTTLEDETGPDEWQHGLLTRIGAELRAGGDAGAIINEAVSSGHGVGKACCNATIVDTPTGPRKWGDIAPGDLVFGADGSQVRVVACRKYESMPVYRVSFDDGSFADVSSGHLWAVRGRQERRKNIPGWRTLETIDILERGVKRANGVSRARQWQIPIQGPAQFEAREIDLHPYFVGLWIGDGSRKTPNWHKPFPEIADRLRSFGYDIRTAKDGVTNRVIGIGHLMTDPLFQCYSHERYIPDDYKYNNVENRMELFRGLMDSDGECLHTGACGYATTSKRLADDVIWLARSLGCKAMMQPTVKEAWYPDGDGERVDCRDCYRITINAPFNPFTLAHRRERYKPSDERYLSRWIDSIEYIGEDAGQCIEVAAPDGLYLANDFIVTHNSACVSWLIHWALATRANTRGVVTANTETQLRTKTWAELGKWHALFIASDLFTFTATAIYSSDKASEKTWRIDAIPWSVDKAEAFAGLHNKGRRTLLLFDEASAIDKLIWETAQGALTDARTQIIWCAFGNPTRTSGEFHDAVAGERSSWTATKVDSRNSKFSNKALLKVWAEEYGEDSDFFRVRVRGEFPRAGSANFFSPDIVRQAMRREVPMVDYQAQPKVIAVDPADLGGDKSVICIRQGLKVLEMHKFSGADTVELTRIVSDIWMRHRDSSAVVIDAIGVGTGLAANLERVPGMPVMRCNVSIPMPADHRSMNLRADLYWRLRDWLENAEIPDDEDLRKDLCDIEYGYDARMRLQLESKKDIRASGRDSPDCSDSLVLSFFPDTIARTAVHAKVRPTGNRKVIWSRTR